MPDTNIESKEAEWELVEQTWRDWREAVSRHYDPRSNELLEQAWAAGLLDTEDGHAIEEWDAAPSSGPAIVTIRQLAEPGGRLNLMRFQRAVGGAGSISGPYRRGSRAAYFIWQAVTDEDIERVWLTLGPFLGPEKFRAFRKALVVPDVRVALATAPPGPPPPTNNSRRARKRRARKEAEMSMASGAGRPH